MRGFEYPTFMVLELIDRGHTESIEDVVELCEDKKLFTYLGEKYNNDELSKFARQEEAESYLQDFVRTFSISDFQKKFGIKRNGLVLIVAGFVNS